jgi:hypothetical protein
MAPEQYEPLTMEKAEDFISRTAWRSAQSTEDVAPHQYVVQKRGQRRDDFTEEEFWRLVELIKTEGRRELWTPPEEWARRWGGKPMKNQYLYIGEYAYWFTCPYGAVPMLNREHLSVQEQNPTRTVLGESMGHMTTTKPPLDRQFSEGNMSETVWVLGPTKSRPPSKLRYHTSPDCPGLRMYTAKACEKRKAESLGYTPCRRNGPCNSATKAGPRPGRNRQMVTAGKR